MEYERKWVKLHTEQYKDTVEWFSGGMLKPPPPIPELLPTTPALPTTTLLDEATCLYRIEKLLERAKLHLIRLHNQGVDVRVSKMRIEEALSYYGGYQRVWSITILKFGVGLKLIAQVRKYARHMDDAEVFLNGKGLAIFYDYRMTLTEPNGSVMGDRLLALHNEWALLHYRAQPAHRFVSEK